MSVRAYKVIKMELEKEPTFNCWHNDFIFNLADRRYFDDGGGYLSFEKTEVECALSELESTQHNDKISENERLENIKILNKILDQFGDEEFIEYNCY